MSRNHNGWQQHIGHLSPGCRADARDHPAANAGEHEMACSGGGSPASGTGAWRHSWQPGEVNGMESWHLSLITITARAGRRGVLNPERQGRSHPFGGSLTIVLS